MKKYTHAWLAYKAIERLKGAPLTDANRIYADAIVNWFKNYNDDITQGAWYPDAVIKDIKSSHIIKISPLSQARKEFRGLPDTYKIYEYVLQSKSDLMDKEYKIEGGNVADRCESIAHSLVDHLKMQYHEPKGSPVSPTVNQIGLLLFMLSHYVADAHVPFHCDARKLGRLHKHVEEKWDNEIRLCFHIDEKNECFLPDPSGLPLRKTRDGTEIHSNLLEVVHNEVSKRDFVIGYGSRKGKKKSKEEGKANKNIWDFVTAICQYSYLLSYCIVRRGRDCSTISVKECPSLGLSFDENDEFSKAVLSDAIDSIARVWFHIWRRYMKWQAKEEEKKKVKKKRQTAEEMT